MISLRKFKKADTKAVALLIGKTFKRFNSGEYIRKSAVQEYIDGYNLKKITIQQLSENFQRTPIFYVAVKNNKIVGMIRGRPFKISNLFVDGLYHKKGIGGLLINKFESEAKKQKSKKIKICASLYAASFYEKMGYKKTTGIRNFMGLKVQPMKKNLN